MNRHVESVSEHVSHSPFIRHFAMVN